MPIDELIKEPRDIVEQIMAQHWDLVSCPCWVCRHGRKLGLGVYDKHLFSGMTGEQRNLMKPVHVEITDEDWKISRGK